MFFQLHHRFERDLIAANSFGWAASPHVSHAGEFTVLFPLLGQHSTSYSLSLALNNLSSFFKCQMKYHYMSKAFCET